MTYRPIHATLTTPERGKTVMRPARAHSSDLWCYWYGFVGPESALAWRVSHIPTGLTFSEPLPSEAVARAWIEGRLDDRWRTRSAGVLAREIAREVEAISPV